MQGRRSAFWGQASSEWQSISVLLGWNNICFLTVIVCWPWSPFSAVLLPSQFIACWPSSLFFKKAVFSFTYLKNKTKQNSFIEVKLMYQKLGIFNVYNLMSFEICLQMWNCHYNQGNVITSKSFLLPILFVIVVTTPNMRSTLLKF